MTGVKPKSAAALTAMRESGRLAAIVLAEVAAAVAPGVATSDLDDLAVRRIHELGAESAFLNYHGFPKSICVSLNEEVIHGIPSARRIVAGDVVSIDVGVRYRGFCGDTATTVMVGVIDPGTVGLVETTRLALEAGIRAVRPGGRLSDVSHAVASAARAGGCAVVREFVGHGIGRDLHEEPQVPNFGQAGKGLTLQPGMTFCIEPMLNRGAAAVTVLSDQWTVVTRDGLPSAHFEHMIAVGDDGAEVLTRP